MKIFIDSISFDDTFIHTKELFMIRLFFWLKKAIFNGGDSHGSGRKPYTAENYKK